MAYKIANILFKSCDVLATTFEKEFKPHAYSEFANKSYVIPFAFVTCYILFCYFGTKFMKARTAFDLKFALAMWNLFLCLFSFIGMCRTVPYLIGNILSKPYENTVCLSPVENWGHGTTGFWVMLFIFSKIPELVDTVFIVLRKKPLIFLHWYHHITVLMFCWNSYASISGSGLYFVAMNYTVHALMYGYYCLQALNMCPKSFPAVLITIAQIAQMFVGTGVCISTWYYKLTNLRIDGQPCANDITNLIAGALMYGSYLYLFVDFAVARYTRPLSHRKTHQQPGASKGTKSL